MSTSVGRSLWLSCLILVAASCRPSPSSGCADIEINWYQVTPARVRDAGCPARLQGHLSCRKINPNQSTSSRSRQIIPTPLEQPQIGSGGFKYCTWLLCLDGEQHVLLNNFAIPPDGVRLGLVDRKIGPLGILSPVSADAPSGDLYFAYDPALEQVGRDEFFNVLNKVRCAEGAAFLESS